MTKIVVIEDSISVRDLWVRVLEERGYEVWGCGTGNEALNFVLTEEPDLVLLDMGLPDMGGADVVAEIRRDFSATRLPIVVVSGSESEEDITQAFSAGACDYLVKPVGVPELSAKVALHLKESQRLKRITLTTQYLPGETACGRYLVEEVLGEGSYGIVYGARDMESGAEVALKLLTSTSPCDKSRFLRECYTLAAIDAPNVVKVVDFGETEGSAYLALERIRGVSLYDWLRDRAEAVSEGELRALLWGMAEALAALESRKVVHRDLKPCNVMLREGRIDQPVLIDFGLAKRDFDVGLTSPNLMLGTPGYMAPELLDCKPLDSRSDLFAVGMIACYLLTRQEAFPQLNGYELLKRMAKSSVEVPTWVSPPLRRLLQDLTATDPDRRPSSPRELLRRLRSDFVAEESPAVARRLSPALARRA